MIMDPSMRLKVEPDGVIRLTLTTNGATGQQWIETLGSMKHYDEDYGKPSRVLLSPDFKPLPAGVKLNVAILPDTFCPKEELTMDRIREEGKKRGWLECPHEAACLIRRDVSQDDMQNVLGLCYLIVMSTPIDGVYPESTWRSEGLFTTYAVDHDPKISLGWGRNQGYIFLVNQEG